MNYGKLTAGTTKTAIDTAKPSEKGEIITYLSRMGDVLHDGAERRNIVGGGVYAGVDSVQQRYVPHMMLWEIPFHVVPGQNVIASQSGQILCDDHIDFLCFDVAD